MRKKDFMKKIIIATTIIITSISFDSICSEKNNLTKSLENLQRATENCTKTINQTIATAEKTTQNIQKLIENLENNRTRYYGGPYTNNNHLRR